jgi:hypothetical protein
MKDATDRQIEVGDRVFYATTDRYRPMKSGTVIEALEKKVKLRVETRYSFERDWVWIASPERCVVVPT